MVVIVTDTEVYVEKKISLEGWYPFLTVTKPEKIDIVKNVAEGVERFYKAPDTILIMKTAIMIPLVKKWSKEEVLKAIEYERYIHMGVLWLYVKKELLEKTGYKFVEDFASWFHKLLRYHGIEDC